jgi:hypothetical protein
VAGTRDRDRIRSSGGSGATSFGTIYGQGIWDYEPNPVPEDDRDLRRYINDELQKIRGVFDTLRGEAWHVIGDTGEPAFSNSWAQLTGGVEPAFYLDVLGVVHIKGDFDTGTSATVAFTLPEGYRPSENTYFIVLGVAGAAGNYVFIQTDGTVTITRTGSVVYFGEIQFSI